MSSSAEHLRIAFAPQATKAGIASSAYIRIVQPLTSEIDDVDVELFRVRTDASQTFAERSLIGSDVLVVSRTAFDGQAEAQKWLEAAATRAIPVVLDIDDGFHLMDETHPEFSIYHQSIGALRLVMARASEIWCSTESLASSITGVSIQPVVIPNSIDPRLWRRYRPLHDPTTRDGDHGLEILYAGTATHGPDFRLILPALDKLAERMQFRLTVVGVAPDLADRPWIRRMTPDNSGQYPRYATWLRDLAPLFDVGIAPLIDNPFNRLKSDIKILEYLALGLAPVASSVGPYAISEPLVTGGLCAREEDWVSRLSAFADTDLLDGARQRAERARETVWQHRAAGATGAKLAARLLALAAQ